MRLLGGGYVAVAAIAGALCLPASSSAEPVFSFEFGGAGTPPPGLLAQTADGAAVDRDGNVWVVDRFASRVVKYDYNGSFIAAFNSPSGGGDTFVNPVDIAATTRNGNVYVVDNGASRVVVMTTSGRFVRNIGLGGGVDATLNTPVGAAVDDRGRVYVADSGRSRIQVYEANGDHARNITAVSNPYRLAIGRGGEIYVTQGSDILWLSPGGREVLGGALASTGTAAGVAWNPVDGRVYVADFGGGVLKSFSSNLATVSTHNSTGTMQGQSNGPAGVAADCRGNVYMVDGAVPGAGGLPGASKVIKFAEPGAPPPPCGEVEGPPPGLDTQVNDIEITQGVHGLGVYTAADAASGPRTRAFGAPFGDVDLRLGGKTVVRVYATLRSGDAGGVGNVPAELTARAPGGARLGPLAPDARPAVLRVGDAITDMAERTDAAGAYTFTLPESWTMSRRLDLTARVNPAGIDCDDACARRSTFTLTGVRFRDTLRGCGGRSGGGRPRPACDPRYGVEIWPIALTSGGQNPVFASGAVLNEPGPAFEGAHATTPANLIVWPWMGQIDIRDLETANLYRYEDCFLGIELGILCDSEQEDLVQGSARTREVLQGQLMDRIQRFKEDRTVSDATIILGLRGRPGARNDGSLPGAMRGKYLEGRDPEEDGGRGYADISRPLGAVSHELQHALGRRHAGGRAACYPDPKQAGESWPEPTDSGAMIGIGLDTRPRSGGGRGPYRIMSAGVGGLPSPFGDLMSYCIPGESAIWISTVGWNQILNYRGISPATTASVRTAQAAAGPVLRVTAVELSTGELRIVGTQPQRGRAAAPNETAPYQLEARNEAGQILASSPGTVTDLPDTSGRLISGEVPRPTGTTQVVVRRGTEAVTRRRRSGNVPRVRLLAPRGGRVNGKRVTVRWRATDADNDALIASVDYSPNGGRTWRTIQVAPSSGSRTIPMTLLSRSRNARLRVRVDDGFDEASDRSGKLNVSGAPPLVRVREPSNRQRIRADAPLRLWAQAFGDFGEPLPWRAVRWFDGRRRLATGASVTVSGLRPGRHRICAVARAGGRTGSQSVTISVRAVTPAFLALDAPAKIKRRARNVTLRVASTVAAKLTIGRKRFSVGPRQKRVSVPVRPGSSTLRLVLRLRSGGKSTSETVAIDR